MKGEERKETKVTTSRGHGTLYKSLQDASYRRQIKKTTSCKISTQNDSMPNCVRVVYEGPLYSKYFSNNDGGMSGSTDATVLTEKKSESDNQVVE